MISKIRQINFLWSVCTMTVLMGTPEYCFSGFSEEFFAGTFLKSAEIDGFTELRAGIRIKEDEAEKELSVMDARLQLELFTSIGTVDFKYKADAWADGVTEQGKYDTREVWIFNRTLKNVLNLILIVMLQASIFPIGMKIADA